MKIQYENGYAIVDGYKFRKDVKSGYYLSGSINGKRIRLHRYIWEKENGKIPKGYDIHHIDHNKDNNDISNLELISSSRHKKIHGEEMSEELKNWYRKNLNENARPKAIEWHKSKEAKDFHIRQYKISLGAKKPIEMICENCGKKYKAIYNGVNRFCSNNCKSAYRRKSGVDDETRKCVACGKEYSCNKYSKRQKCNDCSRKGNKESRQS